MYWPVSTPRVYAALTSHNTRPIPPIDNDNDKIEDDNSYLNAHLAHGRDSAIADTDENDLPPATPTTPFTPGINSVDDLAALEQLSVQDKSNVANKYEAEISYAIEKASRDRIRDLCVSRSGHLFAVITATSMTVWQSKVVSTIHSHHKASCRNIIFS